MEYGQPHTFDYDKLPEKHPCSSRNWRRSISDDFRWEERTLENEIVITSGGQPVALAGNGWIDTNLRQKQLPKVLLEATLFDRSSSCVTVVNQMLVWKGINKSRQSFKLGSAAELVQAWWNSERKFASAESLWQNYTPVMSSTLERLNRVRNRQHRWSETEVFAELEYPTTVEGTRFDVTIPAWRFDISIDRLSGRSGPYYGSR